MSRIYLQEIFKSKYCVLVLIFMVIFSYFLVPEKVFYRFYNLLAVLFILIFALSFTCLIRSVKDRINKNRKQKTGSIFGMLFGVIGLSALHTCTIGAPVCGASIGMAVVSAIFPTIALDFMSDYSITIVLVSIILQVIALYQMKCFKIIS